MHCTAVRHIFSIWAYFIVYIKYLFQWRLIKNLSEVEFCDSRRKYYFRGASLNNAWSVSLGFCILNTVVFAVTGSTWRCASSGLWGDVARRVFKIELVILWFYINKIHSGWTQNQNMLGMDSISWGASWGSWVNGGKKKNFPSHLCSFCVVKTCVCVHVSVPLCVSIDEYVYVYGFVFIVRVTQLESLGERIPQLKNCLHEIGQ